MHRRWVHVFDGLGAGVFTGSIVEFGHSSHWVIRLYLSPCIRASKRVVNPRGSNVQYYDKTHYLYITVNGIKRHIQFNFFFIFATAASYSAASLVSINFVVFLSPAVKTIRLLWETRDKP